MDIFLKLSSWLVVNLLISKMIWLHHIYYDTLGQHQNQEVLSKPLS